MNQFRTASADVFSIFNKTFYWESCETYNSKEDACFISFGYEEEMENRSFLYFNFMNFKFSTLNKIVVELNIPVIIKLLPIWTQINHYLKTEIGLNLSYDFLVNYHIQYNNLAVSGLLNQVGYSWKEGNLFEFSLDHASFFWPLLSSIENSIFDPQYNKSLKNNYFQPVIQDLYFLLQDSIFQTYFSQQDYSVFLPFKHIIASFPESYSYDMCYALDDLCKLKHFSPFQYRKHLFAYAYYLATFSNQFVFPASHLFVKSISGSFIDDVGALQEMSNYIVNDTHQVYITRVEGPVFQRWPKIGRSILRTIERRLCPAPCILSLKALRYQFPSLFDFYSSNLQSFVDQFCGI